MSLQRAAIVVLAGGVGARVGAGINKTLLSLDGEPVVTRSVRHALDAAPAHVVVVVRPEDRTVLSAAIQPVLGDQEIWIVDGGAERHDSEWNALQALAPAIEADEIEVVAIHDAARPLADATMYREVVLAAVEHGGAIPTVPMDHLIESSGVAELSASRNLVSVQTPQAFRAAPLLDAYRQADASGFRGTDTASCVERFTELPIVGVPSSATNIKVTFPEDLGVAEQLLLGP